MSVHTCVCMWEGEGEGERCVYVRACVCAFACMHSGFARCEAGVHVHVHKRISHVPLCVAGVAIHCQIKPLFGMCNQGFKIPSSSVGCLCGAKSKCLLQTVVLVQARMGLIRLQECFINSDFPQWRRQSCAVAGACPWNKPGVGFQELAACAVLSRQAPTLDGRAPK